MAKTSRRGSSTSKSFKSRNAHHTVVQQSVHKRLKSQSVKKPVSKARLEEVTAELDSQFASVQSLYASQSKEKVALASRPGVSVEGLGDILRGL